MVVAGLVDHGRQAGNQGTLTGPAQAPQHGLMAALSDASLVLAADAALPLESAGGRWLRALRHSGFVTLLYDHDRLSQFWFQDLRRLALFLALMRESRWLRDGELGHFSLAALTRQSQMSSARVSQLLGICAATGDFTRRQDPRDARYLVFEPSPAARSGLARLVAEGCSAAALVLNRPNPLPALRPDALHQVYRAFIDHVLDILDGAELDDRGTGSLTFFMVIADLALLSPIVTADFVRRESVRLKVTAATLRNVLCRAEHAGWICRTARMLSMPDAAQSQVGCAFQAVLRCSAGILDAADQALATQALATQAPMAPPEGRELLRA